jgi:hypothetical protein
MLAHTNRLAARIPAIATFALMILFAGGSARAEVLDNVQVCVGTGTNQAEFEIDWYDGTTNHTLAWGYRWNGSATGEQMLDDLVSADPRLYAEVSGTSGYGTAVFGLGYHQSGDQNFPLNPPLTFNTQHLADTGYDGVDDSRASTTAGDQWQEGWYTAGCWEYYTSTISRVSANQSDWDWSEVGMSSRILNNGDFDGWSFDYGFDASQPPPTAPLAAPVLLLSGNLAFGNDPINHTATQTFTIQNIGTPALSVSTIAYPLGFSGNWAGGTIPAGASQTVAVTFNPTLAESYSATITVSGTVTLNSPTTRVGNTIACSGTGTTPSIQNTEATDTPLLPRWGVAGLLAGVAVLGIKFLPRRTISAR